MTSAVARVMFNGESEQSGRVCAVVGPGPLSVLGEVWNGRVSLFIGFQSLCSGSIHTPLYLPARYDSPRDAQRTCIASFTQDGVCLRI